MNITILVPPLDEVREESLRIVGSNAPAAFLTRALLLPKDPPHLRYVAVDQGRWRAPDSLAPQLVSDPLRPQPQDVVEVEQSQQARKRRGQQRQKR